MTHPFGDLLGQFLHRKHGLSQMKLAAGIDQPPQIITLMAKGQRLTGPQARERVVAIVTWLYREGVLPMQEEANALLAAAGMANLAPNDSTEAKLLQCLREPSTPAASPAGLQPGESRTNLPLHLTSFIGRQTEIAQLQQLLTTSRLITLTGAGGVGKTRLAGAVGAEADGQYPNGIWLVELAALADPALVPQTIIGALGIHEVLHQTHLETLIAFIRPRHLLLILDNCEHLISTCAQLVERLLHQCPHLTILATSREALGIFGETVYRVPSLPFPPSGQLLTLDETGGYAAIQLFVDRARSFQPNFRLTDEHHAAVLQICRHLDGIPLAIELAAARMKSLTVGQIATRLSNQFQLLTGGSRTALPRQQTLRAMIDWSYALLTRLEQSLFARLAVFSGGWTLEAAEQVCSEQGVDHAAVLDLLESLVSKSLVLVESNQTGVQARYRMLEPIRQYAYDRLVAGDTLKEIQQRHLQYFLQMVEQERGQVDQLALLEREIDNLRAALAWSVEHDPVAALRLSIQLAIFWMTRGSFIEGMQWFGLVIEQSSDAPTDLRARALQWAGRVMLGSEDYSASEHLLDEGLALARQTGNPVLICDLLVHRASVAGIYQTKYVEANLLLDEALDLARAAHSSEHVAIILLFQAAVASNQEQYARAYPLQLEALRLSHTLKDTRGRSVFYMSLCKLSYMQGKHEEAYAYMREGMNILQVVQWKSGIAGALELAAMMAAHEGQEERAARLLAASDTLRLHTGTMNKHLPERRSYEQTLSRIHSQLDNTRLTRAWSEGQAMTMEQAIAYLLAGLPAGVST